MFSNMQMAPKKTNAPMVEPINIKNFRIEKRLLSKMNPSDFLSLLMSITFPRKKARTASGIINGFIGEDIVAKFPSCFFVLMCQ